MVLPLLDASEELKTTRMSRRQFMRGVTATMGAAFYADQAMSEDKRPSEHWMPAEWEPHERTLMQFVPPQNWPARDYPDAAREWATVANAAAEFEPVSIAVRPQDRTLAGRLLSRAIDIVEMPLNDGWSRDSGPIFVHDGRGERRIRGFTFNGWGEKFPPYDADAKVKWRFADRFGWPIDPIKFVLEGGAISVDGEGTLLTTEECLLHPTRNPGFGKAAQETLLKRKLGVEKLSGLARGFHRIRLPTVMLMDSASSLQRVRCCYKPPKIETTRITRSPGIRNADCAARGMPKAGPWKSSNCRCRTTCCTSICTSAMAGSSCRRRMIRVKTTRQWRFCAKYFPTATWSA